jgi:hypothetical protein
MESIRRSHTKPPSPPEDSYIPRSAIVAPYEDVRLETSNLLPDYGLETFLGVIGYILNKSWTKEIVSVDSYNSVTLKIGIRKRETKSFKRLLSFFGFGDEELMLIKICFIDDAETKFSYYFNTKAINKKTQTNSSFQNEIDYQNRVYHETAPRSICPKIIHSDSFDNPTTTKYIAWLRFKVMSTGGLPRYVLLLEYLERVFNNHKTFKMGIIAMTFLEGFNSYKSIRESIRLGVDYLDASGEKDRRVRVAKDGIMLRHHVAIWASLLKLFSLDIYHCDFHQENFFLKENYDGIIEVVIIDFGRSVDNSVFPYMLDFYEQTNKDLYDALSKSTNTNRQIFDLILKEDKYEIFGIALLRMIAMEAYIDTIQRGLIPFSMVKFIHILRHITVQIPKFSQSYVSEDGMVVLRPTNIPENVIVESWIALKTKPRDTLKLDFVEEVVNYLKDEQQMTQVEEQSRRLMERYNACSEGVPNCPIMGGKKHSKRRRRSRKTKRKRKRKQSYSKQYF